MQNFLEFSNVFFKFYFLEIFYLFIFRQRGTEGESERNANVWLPLACPTPTPGSLARNLGMCPDWELNQRPFGSQASAQSTKPHQLGLNFIFQLQFTFSVILYPSVVQPSAPPISAAPTWHHM